MDVLIERIQEKNSWGKNELTLLLNERASKYSQKVMKGNEAMNSYVKENIVVDTIMHTMTKVQEKPSWGKNIVCDIIFKKLAEEVSS